MLTYVALTMVAAVAGATSAGAFGLEQLTVVAARITGGHLVAATSGASRVPLNDHNQGLVAQDRSRMDLSKLPMSSFGDADETVR